MDISNTDIIADFQALSQNKATSTSVSPQTLLSQFKPWLRDKKLSAVSVKNYISDTRGFLAWLKRQHKLPHSAQDFLEYTSYLQTHRTPRSSLNRKLASLRHFASFLHQSYALPNFVSQIKNIPQDPLDNLLHNFRSHLVKKRHKTKTITNYLSDIRHYLAWATNTVKSTQE